jgi:hypothetical protein
MIFWWMLLELQPGDWFMTGWHLYGQLGSGTYLFSQQRQR